MLFFLLVLPESGFFPNDLLVDRKSRLLLCFTKCFDVSTELSSGDECLQKQLMGKIRTDLFCFQRKGSLSTKQSRGWLKAPNTSI